MPVDDMECIVPTRSQSSRAIVFYIVGLAPASAQTTQTLLSYRLGDYWRTNVASSVRVSAEWMEIRSSEYMSGQR